MLCSRFAQILTQHSRGTKKLKSLYILAKADDSAFCGSKIPMFLPLKIGNDQLPQQNDFQVPLKHWRTSKSSLQESSGPYPLLPTPLVLFKAVAVLILDVHRVILSHAGTFSLQGAKQGQSVEMHEMAL